MNTTRTVGTFSAHTHAVRVGEVGDAAFEASARLDALAAAPRTLKASATSMLTRLIAGAHDALGRDLSPSEIRRIVDAGPMKGRSLDDEDVQEWLAMLEFNYIKPRTYNTVWDEFVAQHIDSVRLPEWLSASVLADLHSDLDQTAGESLADAGWLWALADSEGVDAQAGMDTEDDLADAEGIHSFTFRMGDTTAAIIRHADVDATNTAAIETLSVLPMRDVAMGTDSVALALAIHRNR